MDDTSCTVDQAVANAAWSVRYAIDRLVDHGPSGVEAHLIAASVQLVAVVRLLELAALNNE